MSENTLIAVAITTVFAGGAWSMYVTDGQTGIGWAIAGLVILWAWFG